MRRRGRPNPQIPVLVQPHPFGQRTGRRRWLSGKSQNGSGRRSGNRSENGADAGGGSGVSRSVFRREKKTSADIVRSRRTGHMNKIQNINQGRGIAVS